MLFLCSQTKRNSKYINPALKGKEFKEVYAWDVQLTLSQARNSGARSLDTVIQFNTSTYFGRDNSIVNDALREMGIARVSSRPEPISISNVVEVGFKPEVKWWQFWKK